MRRTAPRPLARALHDVVSSLEPATPLAAVQRAWPDAVGAAIAREAQPVSERAGVLTIACRSSVWAQELDLMGPQIITRLNGALARSSVLRLRCVAIGQGG